MKTKNKKIAMIEIAIVLCSVFLVAIPAIAADQTSQEVTASANAITTASKDDFVLGVYGNANEDDTIDMRDLTYVKLIFFGKKSETELADAKYDGKINPLDFIQIKLIIVGKEKELTFESATETYKDIPSEAITIRKPVKRIVIAGFESAEVLRALNAADKVVGVGTGQVAGNIKEEELFFPELSKLPSIGSCWPYDYEAILNLNPDVIITFLAMTKEQKEKLPGVTEIFLKLRSYTGFPGNVRKLGYILDKEEEAEEFANWYEGWTNEIKSITDELSEDEKTRVFLSTCSKSMGDYTTAGPGNRHLQMCDIAGGRSIGEGEVTGTWPKVDPEWVITKNPEIIILSGNTVELSSGYDTDDPSEMAALREDYLNRPELANVAAVTNGKVYIYASWGGGCLGSGPGCPIGTAYMAKWFHPDLFEDLDPREIHQEYLDRFQRIDFNVYEHGVFVYPPLED